MFTIVLRGVNTFKRLLSKWDTVIRDCGYLSKFIKFKSRGVWVISIIIGGFLNNFAALLFYDSEKWKSFAELIFALEAHQKQNIKVYGSF